MRRRGVKGLAVLLAVLLAWPGAAATSAARFQGLYWPSFEENIYALSPGGGWGDYLALATRGNVLAFIRRAQADEPACALTLYDLAHARALASLPLKNTGWAERWQLGFWAPGSPYTLEEGSLTLAIYDQALRETLRFTPPAGFDLALADPAGQALWCASFSAKTLTRFSLPAGEALEVAVPLPADWNFSGFAGLWPDGILSVFSNDAGQSVFFAASATGFGQMMPVMDGFSWLDGGLSCATWPGGALLMLSPGQNRVLQLSDWRRDDFIYSCQGGLLLAEAFSPGPALRLYDLHKGVLTAVLEAPADNDALGFHHVVLSDQGFAVMADNQYEQNQFNLYLWDFSQSPLNQPISIKETTLASLRGDNDALALSFLKEYGIALHTRQAGAHFVNDTYYGLPLDQEPALTQALPVIGSLLHRLPPGLLEEVTNLESGPLALYLTGGIRPRGEEGLHAPSGLTSLGSNAPFIALDIRDPGGARVLAHELMHLFEDHLEQQKAAGGRSLLEDWLLLCPQDAPGRGFHDSYADGQGWEVSDTRYTADAQDKTEDIWFIDAYSRSYPMEDRARIFEHLLLAEDKLPDVFANPRLLRKAQYLCALLRQGLDSLKNAPTLYWERYLPTLPYDDFLREFKTMKESARP